MTRRVQEYKTRECYPDYQKEVVNSAAVNAFKNAVALLEGVLRFDLRDEAEIQRNVLTEAIEQLADVIADFSVKHPEPAVYDLVRDCVYFDDDSYPMYEEYFPEVAEAVLCRLEKKQFKLVAELAKVHERIRETMCLVTQDDLLVVRKW